MPLAPDAPFPKTQGNTIRSKDWNDAVTEIIRLDNAKLNRAGADRMAGPLSVDTKVGVGLGAAAPDTSLHVAGGNWNVAGSEGDLKIGDANNRFKIGVALGGAGAGDVRLMAQGGTNRLMLGTGTGPDMLTVTGGRVGINTTAPAGVLDVRGDIQAGNSDLYFTKTDHNHTGFGNTLGYAAIENGTNYGALMILGRTMTTNPLHRVVALWDELTVNGPLTITGVVHANVGGYYTNIILGTVPPPGSDVPATAFQYPFESIGTFNMGQNLRFVTLGCYFHTNHSTAPTAYVDGNGGYHQVSSAEVKDAVAPLAFGEVAQILDDLEPVEFVYKADAARKRQFGFIAEDTPRVFTTPDGKMLATGGIVALLTRVVKEQQLRIDRLTADVAALRPA